MFECLVLLETLSKMDWIFHRKICQLDFNLSIGKHKKSVKMYGQGIDLILSLNELKNEARINFECFIFKSFNVLFKIE